MSETQNCILCNGKAGWGSKILADQNRICSKCKKIIAYPNYCLDAEDVRHFDTAGIQVQAQKRKQNLDAMKDLKIDRIFNGTIYVDESNRKIIFSRVGKAEDLIAENPPVIDMDSIIMASNIIDVTDNEHKKKKKIGNQGIRQAVFVLYDREAPKAIYLKISRVVDIRNIFSTSNDLPWDVKELSSYCEALTKGNMMANGIPEANVCDEYCKILQYAVNSKIISSKNARYILSNYIGFGDPVRFKELVTKWCL